MLFMCKLTVKLFRTFIKIILNINSNFKTPPEVYIFLYENVLFYQRL